MKVTPEEFGARMARHGAAVAEIAEAFPLALGRVLFLAISERSPVGPAGIDPHSGLFRGSLAASVGAPDFAQLPARPFYPPPGTMDFERGTAGYRAGDDIFLTNDASSDGGKTSYAEILDGGRRTDSRGRAIGSLQAPDGVVDPALDALSSQAGAIERSMVARLDAGGA